MRRLPDDVLTRLGPLVAGDAAAVGLTIEGRYRIDAPLARGGMGEVFRAHDLRLDRPVALKALAPELSADRWAARLEAEARATARLDHPGIVPIHDLGRFPDGRLFYTMKLVPGRTLAEAIRVGAPRAELVAALAGACRIVQHAHELGVLHRDLKPANVMLEDAGNVYVVDWGIARIVDELRREAGGPAAGPGRTAAGTVVGTLEYMAPEQARGEPARTTSDVYALGAILFEILRGRPPVAGGSSSELLARAMSPRPLEPGSVVDDRDLDAIARKALAPSPEARYAAAGALGDDLERRGRGEPVLARPPGAAERLSRLARRRWPFLVAALLVGAGAGWALRERGEAREQVARREAESDAIRLLEEGRGGIDWAVHWQYDEDADPAAFARRLDESEARFAAAIERAPWLPLAHHLTGRLFELRGDERRAEASYRTAIERDPAFGPARYRLGRMFALRAFRAGLAASGEDQRERSPAAVELARVASAELEAAVADGAGLDDEVGLAVARALLAYAGLDFARARDLAREGLERLGDREGCEDLHWVVGISTTGRESREAIDRAIALAPRSAILFFCRGGAREAAGDLEGAIVDYGAALRLDPDLLEALVNRGALRAATGDLEGAIADGDAALAIDPGHAEALTNRGNARAARGELEAALADHEAAIRAAPGHARAHVNRGIVRKLLGDAEGALADQEEAIRLDPTLPEAYAERALLAAARGDLEGTVVDLRRALEVAPRRWMHRAAVEDLLRQLEGGR